MDPPIGWREGRSKACTQAKTERDEAFSVYNARVLPTGDTLVASKFNLRTLACALALAGSWLAAPASATVYELSEGTPEVFGEVERIRATYEDTLVDIARRFSLGYEEITRVNPGVDVWLPGEGTEIILPNRRILPAGPRDGIVINLPEHRLYYYPKRKKKTDPQKVYTYPVSIGKMDWQTPLGQTTIVSKTKRPWWHPPESVRKEHAARGEPLPARVPPGPDNPLGEYAMRLGITSGAYLIHGTNNPLAVGMAVTHGCIRMYPEDIEELFPLVPVGTKVYLINQPVKVAYVDGELLLEAHPPVDAQGQSYEPNLEEFAKLLDAALGENVAAVHWDYALETLQAARGMPTVIGLAADLDPLPGEGTEEQVAAEQAGQAEPPTGEAVPAVAEEGTEPVQTESVTSIDLATEAAAATPVDADVTESGSGRRTTVSSAQ